MEKSFNWPRLKTTLDGTLDYTCQSGCYIITSAHWASQTVDGEKLPVDCQPVGSLTVYAPGILSNVRCIMGWISYPEAPRLSFWRVSWYSPPSSWGAGCSSSLQPSALIWTAPLDWALRLKRKQKDTFKSNILNLNSLVFLAKCCYGNVLMYL